jgi:hypothetical protein
MRISSGDSMEFTNFHVRLYPEVVVVFRKLSLFGLSIGVSTRIHGPTIASNNVLGSLNNREKWFYVLLDLDWFLIAY